MSSDKQLELRKQEEIEFSNRRYAIEDSSPPEKYEEIYSQRKFYSIAKAGGSYTERLLFAAQGGGGRKYWITAAAEVKTLCMLFKNTDLT